MSEPGTPTGKAPDDRELEAFLARDSELARAWREAAPPQSAPPALDAAIHDYAQRQHRRGADAHWLHRARLPLALAASLVLVVGVLRLAHDLGVADGHDALKPVAMAGRRQAEAPVAPPPKMMQAPPAAGFAPLPPPPAPAVAKAGSQAVAAESAPAPLPAEGRSADRIEDKARLEPTLAAVSQLKACRSAVAGSVDAQAAGAFPPVMQWQTAIRHLQATGQREQAREQWRCLRKVYPQTPADPALDPPSTSGP